MTKKNPYPDFFLLRFQHSLSKPAHSKTKNISSEVKTTGYVQEQGGQIGISSFW